MVDVIKLDKMDVYFDIKEIASAFMVLFAVIDILGAIPIIINLKKKGLTIESGRTVILSFIILVAFYLSGKRCWHYLMLIYLLLLLPGRWSCWYLLLR